MDKKKLGLAATLKAMSVGDKTEIKRTDWRPSTVRSTVNRLQEDLNWRLVVLKSAGGVTVERIR